MVGNVPYSEASLHAAFSYIQGSRLMTAEQRAAVIAEVYLGVAMTKASGVVCGPVSKIEFAEAKK